MRVGADRHDGHDLDRITDQVLDHIAEDVGGDDDRQTVRRRSTSVVIATPGDDHRKGDDGEEKAGDSVHDVSSE